MGLAPLSNPPQTQTESLQNSILPIFYTLLEMFDLPADAAINGWRMHRIEYNDLMSFDEYQSYIEP